MAAAPSPFGAQAPPPPPQAAPGGPPSPFGPAQPNSDPSGDPGSPAVIQLLTLIETSVDRLLEVAPFAAPMVDEIKDQLEKIEAKVADTMSPAQPPAPPI